MDMKIKIEAKHKNEENKSIGIVYKPIGLTLEDMFKHFVIMAKFIKEGTLKSADGQITRTSPIDFNSEELADYKIEITASKL